MKALVKWDDSGGIWAYEVPDGTAIGQSVELPRPWFLDTSSNRMDPLPRGTVVEFGSGTYDGPCRPVVRVIEGEA